MFHTVSRFGVVSFGMGMQPARAHTVQPNIRFGIEDPERNFPRNIHQLQTFLDDMKKVKIKEVGLTQKRWKGSEKGA